MKLKSDTYAKPNTTASDESVVYVFIGVWYPSVLNMKQQ